MIAALMLSVAAQTSVLVVENPLAPLSQTWWSESCLGDKASCQITTPVLLAEELGLESCEPALAETYRTEGGKIVHAVRLRVQVRDASGEVETDVMVLLPRPGLQTTCLPKLAKVRGEDVALEWISDPESVKFAELMLNPRKRLGGAVLGGMLGGLISNTGAATGGIAAIPFGRGVPTHVSVMVQSDPAGLPIALSNDAIALTNMKFRVAAGQLNKLSVRFETGALSLQDCPRTRVADVLIVRCTEEALNQKSKLRGRKMRKKQKRR